MFNRSVRTSLLTVLEACRSHYQRPVSSYQLKANQLIVKAKYIKKQLYMLKCTVIAQINSDTRLFRASRRRTVFSILNKPMSNLGRRNPEFGSHLQPMRVHRAILK